MIKLIIFSLKKSKLLSKIASESGQNKFNANEMFSQAIGSIRTGSISTKRDLYVEELFCLLASDVTTQNLLALYGKSFDDLRAIIKKLEAVGAGQNVKGHYVPVSSIAFIKQLNIILQHWDGENFKIGDLDNQNSNLKMASLLVQSFK